MLLALNKLDDLYQWPRREEWKSFFTIHGARWRNLMLGIHLSTDVVEEPESIWKKAS